ncbi:MAG TPA: YceI family protein, partial [Puia sp.]|nr:YceI family protein [Puia sp.]
QYKPVDEGSSVKFSIKNFGFNTAGSFTGLKGTIRFDPTNPAESGFDVTLDADKINTDNENRDEHLREETYFDVKNYPVIRIVSDRITSSNKAGTFVLFGKLTIKGKTRDISFPFAAEPSGDGFTFKGDFKINRRDFGIGGSSTLSDNVDIFLEVVARKI